MKNYDASQFVQRFSHVGICVTDIEKSQAFYAKGLGFHEGASIKVENNYQNLLGIPGDMAFQSLFMRNGDMVIELIEFITPELSPTTVPRPMNQVGLTHLSFRVRDVDTVSKALESLGGKILHSTRTYEAQFSGEVLFCTDLDGTRIELMAYPDNVIFA